MNSSDQTKNDSTTIDQKRATHALRCIKSIRGKEGHYISYVSALPAVIVTNGLGQALATELAKAKGKKEDPHYKLYEHIAGWLSQQVSKLNGDSNTLIERLMENDQDVYLRAQAEAMAYVHWLKQFARAYLKETEDQP